MFIITLMESMILYDLNDKTHAEQTRIIRLLFGFKDKSNNGEYQYERLGLLSEIPHVRKTKTVLIVERKYAVQVIHTLKKVGVKAILLDPTHSK
jgi:hypothetical protein